MTNNSSNVAPGYVVFTRWILEGILLPSVGIVGIIGKDNIITGHTAGMVWGVCPKNDNLSCYLLCADME